MMVLYGPNADEKAKFFDQFKRFVLSDFKRTLFPKWFYRSLSMTFGHIAHYDINGFYATFFESIENKVRFLKQTLRHGCYGDPAFTYCDVEREIQRWLIERGLLENYQERLASAIETAERAQLARLQAKYGPSGQVSEVK